MFCAAGSWLSALKLQISANIMPAVKHPPPKFGAFFLVPCKQSLQSQLAGQKTMARRASLSKRRRSTVSHGLALENRNPAHIGARRVWVVKQCTSKLSNVPTRVALKSEQKVEHSQRRTQRPNVGWYVFTTQVHTACHQKVVFTWKLRQKGGRPLRSSRRSATLFGIPPV